MHPSCKNIINNFTINLNRHGKHTQNDSNCINKISSLERFFFNFITCRIQCEFYEVHF